MKEIVRFLAQHDPAMAERTGHALIDDALTLEHLPARGMAFENRRGYRRIWHRPWYLIFYRIDEVRRVVEVARFWDARRDPDSLNLR